jgi:sigma-B regulation protein RsbU (phosphoserine phosphatase)
MASPVEALIRDQLAERRDRLQGIAGQSPDADRLRTLLREVDAALERLDRGTYGICETCHDPIEADRLMADPLLEYCLDHLSPTEQRALEQDLDLAARVMRGLLPPPSLSLPGYEIARHYEGPGPVGGDYCDALGAPDGSLHFAIGDVSGKGVAASMLMAHLHATLRALVPLGLPLEELVARASRLFCESALPSHFATLVCGRASRSGEVELCNAGHVPPLVARQGAVEAIASTGLPIGMFCDARFAVTRLRLAPGDAILLYTDGVSETRGAADEEYGIERLKALLAQGPARKPAETVSVCLRDLKAFRAGAAKSDDLTLMAIQRVE